MGGWLATFAQVGPGGELIPTVDREGHLFEAARTLATIDFTPYLKRGLWNDTHKKPKVYVGVPTGLEQHDGTTELSKAHRKAGWWTEGHLWDRRDPRSWTLFTDHEPTSEELNRADEFWRLAQLLKGTARPLGFSAEGHMLLSPCGTRIIWAQIAGNAICETPQNLDSTAIPLELAVPEGRILSPDMLGRSPCETCACPPGARCLTLSKATDAGGQGTKLPTPQDLEGEAHDPQKDSSPEELSDEDRLVQRVQAHSGCTEETARRWVRTWAKRHARPAPTVTENAR